MTPDQILDEILRRQWSCESGHEHQGETSGQAIQRFIREQRKKNEKEEKARRQQS